LELNRRENRDDVERPHNVLPLHLRLESFPTRAEDKFCGMAVGDSA